MERRHDRLPQLLTLLQLLLCGGCPRVGGCNETRMLEMLPRCGKAFVDAMRKVVARKWCDLSAFIVELLTGVDDPDIAGTMHYESFTSCTQVETTVAGCYWPNAPAQGFITGIHRQFFSNCILDGTLWEDPPAELLIPLIAGPVLLTVAMAGLVVWCSRRTGQQL